MSVVTMKSSRNSILSFISLCFIFMLRVQVTISAETRTFDYYQVTEHSIGLSQSSVNRRGETTLLVCANECSSQSQCEIFLWDSNDGTCTSGSWPVASDDIIMPSGSKTLYKRAYRCRFDLGYEIRSFGSNQRCVYLSRDYLNYQDARGECGKHGGHLLKSDSLDLINLMKSIATEKDVARFWVGADDLDSENQYLWSDSQLMTEAEKNQLFSNGEPSGGSVATEEDCIELNVNYAQGLLNDYECHEQILYACEMDIFL